MADAEAMSDDEVFLPASVQQASKSKTSSPGRLSPRRFWPTKSKSQTKVAACSWNPQKQRSWTNHGCRQVVLPDSELTSLSEYERDAIRQLAASKLRTLNLGVQIIPPKVEKTDEQKPKKRTILLKKRAVTTGFFFSSEKKANSSEKLGSQIFGVPLAISCRQEWDTSHIQRSHSTSVEDLSRTRHQISRSGSQASLTYFLDSRENESSLARAKTPSCESLNAEALQQQGFPDLGGLNSSSSELDLNLTKTSQVPDIVNTCFRHLEKHGLNTFGIFRVGSSKKRVRQLRDDIDSGKISDLNYQHCPHDVAALLKQYFRDLPEPLLTRELYPAFLATQKPGNEHIEIEALRYLIQLLPTPNCDTLHALLLFLYKVASKAADHYNSSGIRMRGNKMDSANLATLFGPNILHTVKGGTGIDMEYLVVKAARAEDRVNVINVVKSMIDNVKVLFQVPSEYLHETYLHLLDRKPKVVEHLLNMRSGFTENDMDLDTSSSQLEGTDTSASPANERKSSETSSKNELSVDARASPLYTLPKTPEKTSVGVRLFRRREKSATPEPEGKPGQNRRGSDEDGSSTSASVSTRWFRRREKSKVTETKASCQETEVKGRTRFREGSPNSQQRPLSVQQQQVSVVTIRRQEQRLSVPDIRRPSRRLSSSDAENSSVISASLTLCVPGALQMDDRDIPFIEDAAQPDQELMELVGRQYEKRLSYPSVAANVAINVMKTHRSQDSVLSSEGGSSISGESPSNLRHTPSSDMGCVSASGGSTPLSSSSPPPPIWQYSHSVPASPRTSPATTRYSRQDRPRLSGAKGTADKWAQETTWKRWEIIASEHTETDNAL